MFYSLLTAVTVKYVKVTSAKVVTGQLKYQIQHLDLVHWMVWLEMCVEAEEIVHR